MVEKVWDADSEIADAIEGARRPVVRIQGGDLVEVIDRAEAHLVEYDPNIFHFDQQLVAVRPKRFKIADGKQAVGLRALPLTVHNIIEDDGDERFSQICGAHQGLAVCRLP